MGEIYILTSPSNKVYIGQTKSTTKKRFQSHVYDSKAANGGTCRYLNYALRKYSPEKFKIETLVICEESQLDYYETNFIKLYSSINSEYGYNLREGGNSSNLADSTKKLMSIARTGDKHHFYGLNHSEKSKNQIRETIMNNINRKCHNGNELPKYMKYIKWKDREGYSIVSHPRLSKKDFVSKKLSNEEKYKQCHNHLTQLNYQTII